MTIPSDKALHLAAGAAIALLMLAMGTTTMQAFGATAAVAFVKEARDGLTGKGTAEVMDSLCTMVGGGVVAGLAHILR